MQCTRGAPGRDQEEYAALLRKELQPTLEYFELINEELMEEKP